MEEENKNKNPSDYFSLFITDSIIEELSNMLKE